MARERTARSLVHTLETTRVPLEQLKAIRELRKNLDGREYESLIRARRLGCSVGEIAEALGVTRQGVYNKLRHVELKREAEIKGEPPVVLPDLEDEHRS
jgi:DNA-binding CsgD family transcriptional regulator